MNKGKLMCNKGCGEEICFDIEDQHKIGRWRPLDPVSKKPHVCPTGAPRKDIDLTPVTELGKKVDYLQVGIDNLNETMIEVLKEIRINNELRERHKE